MNYLLLVCLFFGAAFAQYANSGQYANGLYYNGGGYDSFTNGYGAVLCAHGSVKWLNPDKNNKHYIYTPQGLKDIQEEIRRIPTSFGSSPYGGGKYSNYGMTGSEPQINITIKNIVENSAFASAAAFAVAIAKAQALAAAQAQAQIQQFGFPGGNVEDNADAFANADETSVSSSSTSSQVNTRRNAYRYHNRREETDPDDPCEPQCGEDLDDKYFLVCRQLKCSCGEITSWEPKENKIVQAYTVALTGGRKIWYNPKSGKYGKGKGNGYGYAGEYRRKSGYGTGYGGNGNPYGYPAKNNNGILFMTYTVYCCKKTPSYNYNAYKGKRSYNDYKCPYGYYMDYETTTIAIDTGIPFDQCLSSMVEFAEPTCAKDAYAGSALAPGMKYAYVPIGPDYETAYGAGVGEYNAGGGGGGYGGDRYGKAAWRRSV